MTAPSASMAPAITHWRSTTKTATETASGTTAAHPPITAPLLVRVSPVHDGRLRRRAVDLGDESPRTEDAEERREAQGERDHRAELAHGHPEPEEEGDEEEADHRRPHPRGRQRREPVRDAVGAPVRRDGVREPLAHRRDDDPRQRKHDGRPRDGQDQVPPRRVVQGPEPGPIAGHAATSVVG